MLNVQAIDRYGKVIDSTNHQGKKSQSKIDSWTIEGRYRKEMRKRQTRNKTSWQALVIPFSGKYVDVLLVQNSMLISDAKICTFQGAREVTVTVIARDGSLEVL